MHLVIWDTSKWEIVVDKLSQYHPMISTIYDVSLVNTKLGLQLIWPVYTQINFWNLDTGKESVTLKMVSDGFLYILSLLSWFSWRFSTSLPTLESLSLNIRKLSNHLLLFLNYLQFIFSIAIYSLFKPTIYKGKIFIILLLQN